VITAFQLKTVGWLVRDTFRQSLAHGIFWILLATSGLATLVCLSLSVEGSVALAPSDDTPDFLPRDDRDARDAEKVKTSGVAVVSGQLSLAFGAIQLPLARDAYAAVHFLELILAGGVADTLGLLIALVWTAGFLPSFLEGRSVSVLLAKPAGRWTLLLGKYLGVLIFVLMHATIFVGGTWLAIGARTGIWDAAYLLSIPLLLLHFCVFFSFSVLLAVLTHSTVACVFGSIVFWGLAWGMNYGRHALAAAEKVMPEGSFSAPLGWMAEVGYWVLPKPADFGMLLFDTLEAGQSFGRLIEAPALEAQGFSWTLSILTSLAFALYTLCAAARKFQTSDY